jgi:hypothetical protein
MKRLDETDRRIVAEWQHNLDDDTYRIPCVGDWVGFADGRQRRIAEANTQYLQSGPADRSYHLIPRTSKMSFSGGPDVETLQYHNFVKTGERRLARAWIFHHDEARSGNGVDVWVSVPVWRYEASR